MKRQTVYLAPKIETIKLNGTLNILSGSHTTHDNMSKGVSVFDDDDKDDVTHSENN
jgi:hypothetical protein